MVVTCEIKFDQNPYGTYFTGQLVSGTVSLVADKPKVVKGVLLKVTGHATTRWSERRTGRNRSSRVFSGREDYMASLTYLVGSEQSTQCTVDPGIHTYTFACQLPYNCPSSFEGMHGHIRYVVKVQLIRPWKFDQTYLRAFTVLKMTDLNYETPQLRVPSSSSAYKVFCCGPCKTEPLQMQLDVPQTGFVPGQIIPVTALVINNTNLAVKEVKFSLVMLVRYYSQHPYVHSRVESITVAKAKGDEVLRNCTRSISTELLIPATPPTCLTLCRLVQIVYQVEVEAKMKGMHANQVISMPVTIGNVPLYSGASAVVMHQPSSSHAVAELNAAVAPASLEYDKQKEAAGGAEEGDRAEVPITVPIAAAAAAMYPSLPPPSYEESMHTERGNINDGELHAFGPSDFAPLYPVFEFPNAVQPFNTSAPTDTAPDAPNGGYVNQSFEN